MADETPNPLTDPALSGAEEQLATVADNAADVLADVAEATAGIVVQRLDDIKEGLGDAGDPGSLPAREEAGAETVHESRYWLHRAARHVQLPHAPAITGETLGDKFRQAKRQFRHLR